MQKRMQKNKRMQGDDRDTPTISAHLNKPRSVHSIRSNSVIARKGLTSPLDQRSNSQPIRKARLEWEASLKMIRPSNLFYGGDRNRHWHILTREVHNRIRIWGHFARHGELERHVLGRGRRDDSQRTKRGQVDVGQRLRA